MNYSVGNDSNITLVVKTVEKEPFNCYTHPEFLIRVIADVWISLPLATFGILGNVMAFIVLVFYRQKFTTTIILQVLALVDTLILLFVILLRSLRYTSVCFEQPTSFEDLKEVYKHMFYWMYPSLYVLRMIDTWLITLLTCDRWIAVCKPLQAQNLCRLGLTWKRIIIVVVAAIIFSFPRFLESKQYGIPDHINPAWGTHKFYVYIYKIGLFFIFMYLIPTAILVILNVKLLISLRVSDPQIITQRHSSKKNKGVILSSQHRSITIIVVAVVTIYFICSILAITSHFVYSLQQIDSLNHVKITWLSSVNNVFITLNSASNFFIYCICSKNFRTVMYRTFGCQNCKLKQRFLRSASARNSSSNGGDTLAMMYDTQEAEANATKMRLFMKPITRQYSQIPSSPVTF